MRRLLLILGAALVMAAPCRSQGFGSGASPVSVKIDYDMTCSTVAISNATPTELTGNSTTRGASANVYSIMVMNLDNASDLWCSQDSSVASAKGQPIMRQGGATAPYNWFSWLVPIWRKWYCINTGGAPTSAMVCKARQ